MADTISASEFHARDELPDWRIVLGRIEAGFQAPSFHAAGAFVGQVAAAADAAAHRAAVDLRHPGHVRVALTTHDHNELSPADVELARAVSGLAAEAGLASRPHLALAVEVGIDALDIDAVRPFWKAVLGYDDAPTAPGEQVLAVVDPLSIGPPVWFQQMDAPRPQRNRIHVDVTVAHDVAEERVAAAIAAGGRLVSDKQARAWWVLADAEGNEACVCTWQDRG
jgi:4a-hydroxytetrahydrobiopterin dehydratase